MALPNPKKYRRYPFKRQLKRKLRKIAFMLVAVALVSGIDYYNKSTNNPQQDQSLKESTRLDTSSTPKSNAFETDPKTLHRLEQARKNPDAKLWVKVRGKVIKLLKDDLHGSRHQKFLINIDGKGFTLLVSHNIDLAKRVPIEVGDAVTLFGLYEWNNRGGLIHWTHHDPKGKKKGGWIRLGEQEYR